MSRLLELSRFRFTIRIALIYIAISNSILVTQHMLAILTNLTIVVISSSGSNVPKVTLPIYSHYISNLKLWTVTTSSISARVVDYSSPSRNFPSNVEVKYGDYLQISSFQSLYS